MVGGTLVVSGLSLAVIAIATARVLGPAVRGELVLIIAVVVFTSVVATLGVHTAGQVHLVSLEERVSQRDFVGLILVLGGIEFMLCMCAAWIVGLAVDMHLTVGVLLWTGLYGAATLIGDAMRQGAFGIGRPIAGALLDAGGSVAQLVFVVVALEVMPTLEGVVAAMALGYVVQAAFGLGVLLRDNVGAEHPAPWKRLVKTGSPAMIGGLSWSIILRGDRLLLGVMRGPTAVGVYSVAATVTESLWVLPRALADVVFHPIASGQTKRGSFNSARWIIVGVTAGLAAVLFLAAPWFIQVFFGNAYAGAVAPMRLLLPGAVALASFQVDYTTLAAHKRMHALARLNTFSLFVLFPAEFLGITIAGLSGAALATSIVYTGMAITIRVLVRNHEPRV